MDPPHKPPPDPRNDLVNNFSFHEVKARSTQQLDRCTDVQAQLLYRTRQVSFAGGQLQEHALPGRGRLGLRGGRAPSQNSSRLCLELARGTQRPPRRPSTQRPWAGILTSPGDGLPGGPARSKVRVRRLLPQVVALRLHATTLAAARGRLQLPA